MKYFLHDTNSFDDEKITELFLNFGYEGLGLFYTTLEKIGKQEKPVKTTVLKAQLKVGKRLEKCWKFMEEIGLLSSNNGDTFNKQLLNFSETYQIKKEKTRIKVAEWRKCQEDKESVTSYVPVSNLPKVKESKVKESYKEEEVTVPFENFWNLYDKKVDRKKCEPKWNRLTDNERTECIDKLPAYINSTPDKRFRRDPETYLNNKSWENEIISQSPVKIDTPKTYEEMLELTKNNPDLWKRFKSVKKDGERKAVFIPINQ